MEQIQGLAIMVNHQPLGLAFRLSWLVANPLESPCGNQAHNQEVVAAKTGGVLPCVSVLVGALEGDVEQGTFVGFLAPDARADDAVADFVDGLAVWCTSGRLIFHDVLCFVGLMVMRESVGGACSNRHRPVGIRTFSRCCWSQTKAGVCTSSSRVWDAG
jgi:hypothetical protein